MRITPRIPFNKINSTELEDRIFSYLTDTLTTDEKKDSRFIAMNIYYDHGLNPTDEQIKEAITVYFFNIY